MSYGLVLIPFLSAFTGWFAVRILLITMFHPVQARKIGGFRLQGIFPENQGLLAEKMGKMVEQEFTGLENRIAGPGSFQKLLPLIEEHVDDFLRIKLPKQMPVIGMLIGERTIGELKTVFIAELESLFPVIMKSYLDNAASDLDLARLVKDKISNLEPLKLEYALRSGMAKEIRKLGFICAAMGFGIGIIQVLLVILL